MIGFALAIAAGLCGLVAAWLWYRSGRVEAVPAWSRGDRPDPMNEPVVRTLAQDGYIAGTLAALAESAEWNRRAALWTALSVLLTVASALAARLGY